MADVERILATIRHTESGGNYTARNSRSTASGAYQFINSTWRGAGGTTRTAAEASPEEQDRVARQYVTSILAANGDDPRAVFKTWYVGNPNAAEGHVPNPEAGNTLSVGAYADLQMRRLGGQPAGERTEGAAVADDPVGTPEEVAAQLYGYLAAYMNEPVVGEILRRAAVEKWSPDRLRGALHATDWWRATNDAAKQWGALEAQNPTEVESRIGERIAELQDRAQQAGYSLSPEGLREVAINSLKYGWNVSQQINALGAEVLKRPGDLEGLRQSTLAGRLRQTKSDYAVPMSSQAMDQWTADVVSGRKTEDDFQTYLVGVAKSMFPTIGAALDGGSTVAQIFDPYRQIAAETLSIAPDTIDLSDPKWSGALAAVDDKGNRVPLRLDQWQQVLRSDAKYGYQFTSAARGEAERLAETLAETFGRV